MISKLEILPNEIFFNIFSHLLWNDILTSFWSLNKRFNSLICLNFSINNCGIIINKTSLSYKIFLSKLFPLISNCSSLINSIRHIHLDGRCPNSYEFINKNRCIYNYPNLKSFVLDRFYLSELLINNLCFLIQGQLNKLTMILDKDSTVDYDGQLYYLKWFFNNLNSVENIKIRLKIDGTCEKNPIIYGSIIDANFIWKYLMSDTIINLIHFDFYIVSKSYNEKLVDLNTERAKILARIISMPVQLNYLRIKNFQWLLHLVEYAFDELKENALSNVRYTEFSLPSCRFGTNESIHLGKYLVPFLSKYMPYLQTLCLWRPDDFPWSSIRPDFNRTHYRLLAQRWSKSLKTVESINKHVTLFENDLSQLVEQLKQFVYLNIYGYINDEKVEPYRLMIQKRFPNSYFSIEKSRFRLWI
ncbi:unnamed protein product [Rotaria sordida]|uniref:F-box domain-containing protein n=1 Tax=Rotaria sordida TaxID=392033 RepID=A0A815CDI7_9BILA|nr:unnamed protein product [Rotaria sordida]